MNGMICPHCNIAMVIGVAINPGDLRTEAFRRSILPHDHVIPAEEVSLAPCYKCPKCGHSEELETS